MKFSGVLFFSVRARTKATTIKVYDDCCALHVRKMPRPEHCEKLWRWRVMFYNDSTVSSKRKSGAGASWVALRRRIGHRIGMRVRWIWSACPFVGSSSSSQGETKKTSVSWVKSKTGLQTRRMSGGVPQTRRIVIRYRAAA